MIHAKNNIAVNNLIYLPVASDAKKFVDAIMYLRLFLVKSSI